MMMKKMNNKIQQEFKILEKFTTFQDDDLFHRAYITLHVNHQPAGFVRVIYIGDEIAQKKLNTVTDFFIYKVNNGNEAIRKAYENNDLEFLCKKFKSFITPTNNLLKDWESIQEAICQNYNSKFLEFVDYWVNKPSRELIYVLDEKDKQFSIIQEGKEVIVPSYPQNWRGKGIGKLLADFSVEYAHGLRLHLWQSKNQTAQGKKLWKFTNLAYEILHAPSRTVDFDNQRAYSKMY